METGTLIGSHRVEMKLGEGGMADVYKVWNVGLHRYEALKAPKLHFAHDPTFVERFLTEARTAAGLQHAHIATIHTVSDVEAAQPFFTMELVDGGDLSDLLSQRGRVPLPDAIALLRQIGTALDYAHSRGIIHRDVKPANVLLQDDGRGLWNVKVVDFGIARAQEAGNGARLTKTGMIVGTPEYMSPEQGGSGPKVDQRTDVYSLGVIAYEMLCGRPPFTAGAEGSAITVIMSHIREQPRPPVQEVPGLPLAVNNAILKALAKDPADRFQTCTDFVNALAGNVAVEVPNPSKPHPQQNGVGVTAKTASGSRLIPVVLSFVVILGIALVVIGLNRAKTGDNGVSGKSSTMNAAASGSAGNVSTLSPPQAPQPQKIKVPDLTGMNEKQARAMLSDKSLSMEVTTGQSATVPSGRIMSQSPSADASTTLSEPVTVRISTGPPPLTVASTPPPVSQQTYSPPQPVYVAPVVDTQEARSDISQTIMNWKSAWERLDISGYMSNYASNARIRSNKRWYSYSQYYSDESTKFAQGGTVQLSLGDPNITVEGDTATATFGNTFQRFGGRGDYRSAGVETFKLRKDGGRWLIYEDVFQK